MARNQRLRGMSVGMAKASASYGSYQKQPLNPFGPQMACDIFGVYDYDDMDECVDADDSYYGDEVVSDDVIWYQPELPLENVREMENRHLQMIKKYERAYRKMAISALKWHYLQEDLEDNSQLKQMFDNIQLMRKLGGSTGV